MKLLVDFGSGQFFVAGCKVPLKVVVAIWETPGLGDYSKTAYDQMSKVTLGQGGFEG